MTTTRFGGGLAGPFGSALLSCCVEDDLSGGATLGGVTLAGDSSASGPPPASFEHGDRFAERYRIERCMGRGAMGTVYAAHDDVVHELIALKVFNLHDPRAIEGLGREVRLARRVTHRNAARTFDLGEHGGLHFITMELVDGESLRVRLARLGRLPLTEAIDLGHQLGQGLQAAHDVGVVHRDLKPANIMVTAEGRVVITDFGLARTTAEEPASADDRAPMVGTPMYMAPEQVEGGTAGPEADVYALGLVLYEVLTGQQPFGGTNRVEIALARLSQTTPDPRRVAPVPDDLAELILHCLARRPEQRPSNPGAVAQRLLAMLGALSGGESSSGSSLSIGRPDFAREVERTLAVVPFRYRGPADDEYLAEALTDELIDLLAMTRGLRVSASGATTKYREERDARTIGRALGVDAIIDGTVMRTADRIRITVRLIDVDTGFQRSAERFEGRLQDVFELQDRMAKRVAESLRVELSVLDLGRRIPEAAVTLYLRGRKRSREPDLTGRSLEDVATLLEQALELAPGFPLALAARADAAVRRWFLTTDPDAEAQARKAVAAALDGADHLAETRLAAARLDVSDGQFGSAARHLTAALEIAPTCAAAHEYLGLLQCDAGRSDDGVRHIELAHELDPSLHQAAYSVLRWYALRGKHRAWRKRIDQMRLSSRFFPFAVDLFEFRLSLWAGDADRARAVRWRKGNPQGAPSLFSAVLRDALEDEHDDAQIAARLREVVAALSSPRHRAAWGQIATEVLAFRGAHEAAMAQLSEADGTGVLLDSDWFSGCPLLGALREDPRFGEMEERVRARAEEIWQLGE